MKVSMIKSLEETTGRKPQQIKKKKNDGGYYETAGYPNFKLLATSAPSFDENKGKYVYTAVDNKTNLEYEVKSNTKVNCGFGTILDFINFTGGLINTRGATWWSADDVKVVPRKQ